MSNIGNLSFSVHLQDMTDADIAKIKQKLQNLSLSLNIDGNNIKVSNADVIKKQIENAVKTVDINSISIDAKSFGKQIESAAFMTTPKVRVEVLKDNLTADIQTLLGAKTFNIKVSVSNQISEKDIKKFGTVSIPVKLTVDKKTALEGLKKSLLKMTVPIGVKMKDAKSLAADIRSRMKNMPVKVDIDANKNTLRSNINQALKGQKFTADLKLNIQTVDVQTAIRQAFAKAGLQYNTTASNVRANLINTRQQKADAYSDAQQALADLRRAQAASAQAALQQRNAMQGVNDVAEKQKGVFATLRENVANAYAVYRVGRFLNTAMRIGGEFQQQHIALQTIIGDADKANALFERIKNLAVESPFKMLDLSKYTKQLAAFSIPYEELYDTLKRFGDFSAGLGVDMGRIILAYGQVRSAEFLKGTELRQFTEAGIPLVTELAKRYTELEGTLVSVGDVYDRISKKEVPFTDVKAVLWDLTNEGGRFFEMQAVLTDTLKGKLDKLIDSYEIFLSEVGNSNNEILGNSLDLLTDALSHWELIQNAIMGAVSAYGTYKATLIAVAAVQKTTMAVDGVMKLIKSIQFLRNTTLSAAAAQVMWNKVSAINPWVALATVLATVAGSFFLFKENAESAAEANARLNAELEKERDTIENTKNKAEDLVSVMRNEKNTIDSRKNAYSELQNIYPSLFKNMSYEQAMLLKEIELRGMVADAAKRETREKIEASLVEARQKLSDAQTKEGKVQKQYDYAVSQGVFIDKWEKELKKAKEEAADFQNSVYNLEESLALLNKKEADLSEQRKSRWYTESKKIAEEAGLKSLIPTDKETDVWEYFDRIKQGMDDIKKRKDLLDPKSENYSTMLGNLDAELEAYEKIYYGVLGGKNEEAIKAAEEARKKREKQLQDEAKQNEKAGKEAAKAFADGVKSEMERITSQWDLYKQLFDLTGDKQFASTAFTVTPVWDEAAEQMLEEMKRALESQGLDTTVEFNISDNVAKAFYGNLYDSWKQIKDRIEKNGIDLKINTGNAIKEAKDFEMQVEEIERELHEKLELIGKSGLPSDVIGRLTQSLIENAERATATIEFDKFKKEIGYTQFFANLEHQGVDSILTMRDAMLKFGDSANLTHEEMAQIADDIERMMDVLVKNHPFKAINAAAAMKGTFREEYKIASENFKKNPSLSNANILASAKANLDMAEQMMIDSMSEIQAKFEELSNVVSGLSSMFEKFGNTGLKHFAEALESASSGMSTGTGAGKFIGGLFGQGGAGGIVGGFVGAATGAMAGLVDAGRKAVAAEQERSQIVIDRLDKVASLLKEKIADSLTGLYNSTLDATSRMEMTLQKEKYDAAEKYYKDKGEDINPNTLYATTFDNTSFSWDTNEYLIYSKKTHEAINKALEADNEYMAMYASLLAQRDEMLYQQATYTDKDSEDVEAFKRDKQIEIEKITMEIEQLSKDMMSSLYSVDFQDWSSKLANSIVNAWATGEDAAKAYEGTVSDIMRNVATSLVRQQVIGEYLSKNLKPFIDEFIAKNGIMDEQMFSTLGDIVDGVGDRTDDALKFMDSLEKVINEKGLTLKDLSDSSEKGGLSKGIQSVTEDTANLLASYVNSMRADLSVNRTLIEQLVSVDVPQISIIAQAQLQQLQQVAANTRRNADAADRIYELVNKVVDKGGNKLRI